MENAWSPGREGRWAAGGAGCGGDQTTTRRVGQASGGGAGPEPGGVAMQGCARNSLR